MEMESCLDFEELHHRPNDHEERDKHGDEEANGASWLTDWINGVDLRMERQKSIKCISMQALIIEPTIV